MILLFLCLLLIAAALGGAAFALWWVSPLTPEQRHIDGLARRDRGPRVLP